MTSRRNLLTIGVVLALVTLLRLWIIISGGISFDSDEAIVTLMARHIAHGKPIPTFFYGQAYMGSLSAILAAGGFSLFGESVETARIVQSAEFLLTLLSGYALARAVTGSARVAAIALLIMAFPSSNATLFTVIPVGGWHEAMLCGNLVLLVGWQVSVGRKNDLWRWTVLGAGRRDRLVVNGIHHHGDRGRRAVHPAALFIATLARLCSGRSRIPARQLAVVAV